MRHRQMMVLGFSSVLLASCANGPKEDPFETYNRSMFGFNKAVDTVLVKPLAYTYKKITPPPIQYGVGNAYDNVHNITTVANDALQLKPAHFVHDLSRLLINSTVGVLGFFDAAAGLGLEKRKEDFGQTLMSWGYKESNYLVLPIIGPSTVRDTIGVTIDYFALSPWPHLDPQGLRYGLLAGDYIETRAHLFKTQSVLEVAALDEYSFIRNAYLQKRNFEMRDGKSEALILDEDYTEDDLTDY